MSTSTIRIKRRNTGAVGAPSALAASELAYNEVDGTLYYGVGNNAGQATSIVPVGGASRAIPEAPNDGSSYGRVSANWGKVLPLSGGTMTGALTLNGAPSTTLMAATKGYVDGLASSATPLMDGTAAAGAGTTWARADHVHPSDTSRVAKAGDTMTGNLTIAPSAPTLILNKPASGTPCVVTGQTNNVTRWQLAIGDNASESGSNAGSNFLLYRFNDAGTPIDVPLSINRQTAAVVMTGTLNIQSSGTSSISIIGANGPNSSNLYMYKGASGQANNILGTLNGTTRWNVILGDGGSETGGNTGSNLAIYRYADNGGYLDTPLFINRANGQAQFSQPIINGSDRVSKYDIAPISEALDKVMKLSGVTFNFVGGDKRNIGLVAQDVQPHVPEVVFENEIDGERRLGIAYSQLTALLVEAIKTLVGRIEALETQRR